MINNQEFKLSIRYLILMFFIYLVYKITTPEWILSIKGFSEAGIGLIYTSVFGALTFILKAHFETKVSD